MNPLRPLGRAVRKMMELCTGRTTCTIKIPQLSHGQNPTGGSQADFQVKGYQEINRARMEHLRSLALPLRGKRVIDVGCGVGDLAKVLLELECNVFCVDGREDNIAYLRNRYPELPAEVADVQTVSLNRFGRFDVVFCYGLLYHLENPIAAVRNMASICGDLLLLETMVTDHPLPVLRLVDELVEPTQALRGLGCRPSPSFVVLTLLRAGFPYVYLPTRMPVHPDFNFRWRRDLACNRNGHGLRCIFVASRSVLNHPEMQLLSSDQRGEGLSRDGDRDHAAIGGKASVDRRNGE